MKSVTQSLPRFLSGLPSVARHQVTGFKDFFLCVVASILLILSFPRFNIWLFAWFGFMPLLLALEGKSKSRAFLLSYLCGFLFWWGIIYWLVHVTFLGTLLLVSYLALYFGIFGLIIPSACRRPFVIVLLLVPSVWVILEYIRSHLFTGFPWALLGYSQYLNLPVIQIADIIGAWGVSFLVMLVNTAAYTMITRLPEHQKAGLEQKYLFPILAIVIVLFYGYYKLYLSPVYQCTSVPVSVSLIQGNIPQELKWNPQAKDYIVDKYLKFSSLAAKDEPDLLVWPEAALPVILEEEPVYFEKVRDYVVKNKISLLLGAVAREGEAYHNSAILIDPEKGGLTRYNKLHLVPFGEYIPLKKALPFLETVVPIGDIAPGKEYTIFKIPNPTSQVPNKFAVLICFEDLFPELSRKFRQQGAEFLINITNDAWYKKTSAASQHLQASVFRAVENRVWLVRAANTGVSGFIAPSGRISSLVQDRDGRDIFVDGYSTQTISITRSPLSFYARQGDILPVICFLFALYVIISPRKEKI